MGALAAAVLLRATAQMDGQARAHAWQLTSRHPARHTDTFGRRWLVLAPHALPSRAAPRCPSAAPQVVTVGIVGGSDLKKIAEQIGADVTTDYDYVFSENGLLAHKAGEEIGRADIKVSFAQQRGGGLSQGKLCAWTLWKKASDEKGALGGPQGLGGDAWTRWLALRTWP